MRLDSVVELMVDGAHGEVLFEFFERLFDFGELEVKLPQLCGVTVAHVGAQEIAAFASPGFAQFCKIELVGERGGLVFSAAVMLGFYDDESGVAACFFFGGSEFLVEDIAFDFAFGFGEGFEFFEVNAEASAAHGAFFFDSILTLGEHVGFAVFFEQFDSDAGARLLPRKLD